MKQPKLMTQRLRPVLPVSGRGLAAIVLMFVGSVVGFAQANEGGQNDPLHGQHILKPFRIIGNIYYVGLDNNTSYLITTPQGHIFIDPTYEGAVPLIRKSIEQLGFRPKDIKFVLNAHAHGDHVEGLAAFKELTGGKVLVMSGDAPAIADGGKSTSRNGQQQWRPVRVDKTLHDGDEVRLGGVTLVAHLTPGHTKGCTTWSTVAEENGRKYNVVFVCSVGVNAGTVLVGNTKYPEIAEDYKKSFSVLRSLPCDVFLASHGRFFHLEEKVKRMEQGGGSNPFIDPAGYQAYITESERLFQEALQKAQSAAPQRGSSTSGRGI